MGLTSGDAAPALRRHVNTSRRLDRQGILPARRIRTRRRRNDPADLEAHSESASAGTESIGAACLKMLIGQYFAACVRPAVRYQPSPVCKQFAEAGNDLDNDAVLDTAR